VSKSNKSQVTDRPTRDELGLRLAAEWATMGTCGRRKVGCVLTDAGGRQLGSGYNGPPSGDAHCSAATPCPGFGAPSGTALSACEAVHAEINALIRCAEPAAIHTAYVTVSPCVECVKALMNTSCRRIVFAEPYAPDHVEVARRRWERKGREWVQLGAVADDAMWRTGDTVMSIVICENERGIYLPKNTEITVVDPIWGSDVTLFSGRAPNNCTILFSRDDFKLIRRCA
jgi:dCMP deaminase